MSLYEASQQGDGSLLLELLSKRMTQIIVNNAIERARPELVKIAEQVLRECAPAIKTHYDQLRQEAVVALIVKDPNGGPPTRTDMK